MRTSSFAIIVATLAGVAATSSAQVGVRAKSPRRDAGQHALRLLAESRANRIVHGDRYHFVGPSHIASGSRSRHDGYTRGIAIGGRFGDAYGRVHLGHEPYGHSFGRVVYVNRIPYAFYGGGYYRCDDYGDYRNRRQVIQSPTVIVVDRTGVSTNEVDPQEPITIDESSLLSPQELGRQALYAGNAEQAVELLTEHVLANEGDRAAERMLGIALVLDDQIELGVALIARAYKGDPELAFSLVGRDTIDSLSDWRRVQREVQRYATVQRTASAWLAAIVITQEELPARVHEERLENARRAGLHPDIADAFQRYLEGGEPLQKAEDQLDSSEPATDEGSTEERSTEEP